MVNQAEYAQNLQKKFENLGRRAVAQLAERPSKGPESVQLS